MVLVGFCLCCACDLEDPPPAPPDRTVGPTSGSVGGKGIEGSPDTGLMDSTGGAGGEAADAGYGEGYYGEGGGNSGGIDTFCYSTCDCPPSTQCVSGRCEPSVQEAYCCVDANCPEGEMCDTPEGIVSLCGFSYPGLETGTPGLDTGGPGLDTGGI